MSVEGVFDSDPAVLFIMQINRIENAIGRVEDAHSRVDSIQKKWKVPV
jgi:hypothetical protein